MKHTSSDGICVAINRLMYHVLQNMEPMLQIPLKKVRRPILIGALKGNPLHLASHLPHEPLLEDGTHEVRCMTALQEALGKGLQRPHEPWSTFLIRGLYKDNTGAVLKGATRLCVRNFVPGSHETQVFQKPLIKDRFLKSYKDSNSDVRKLH